MNSWDLEPSASARRTRPWRARAAAGALAFLVAFSATAAPALAETLDEAELRLRRQSYYVKALDRGWEGFLAEASRTIAELGATGDSAPGVFEVRDGLAWTYADRLEKTGDPAAEAKAYGYFDVLAATSPDRDLRARANERAALIDLRRGERFESTGDDDGALVSYRKAAERLPGDPRPIQKVVSLSAKKGVKHAAAQEFVEALVVFADVVDNFSGQLSADNPALAEIKAKIDEIGRTTGEVHIAWLGDAAVLARVKGPKVDYGRATLNFEPTSGGARPPSQSTSSPSIRVRNGSYTVKITGSDPGRPLTESVTVSSGGVDLNVVRAWPAGMVLVRAVSGSDAFFIDRTEVASGDFGAYARSSRVSYDVGEPRLPARNLRWADAQGYARWAGKELPSQNQWRHAAFGATGETSQPRYPWGAQPGANGSHYVGQRAPLGSVDGCAAGASRFCGALNMAGNVMEWCSDGWAVGGNTRAPADFMAKGRAAAPGSGLPPQTFDLLRHAIPAFDRYTNMQGARKSRYFKYRIDKDSQLAGVGMRCIVLLGQPRRDR